MASPQEVPPPSVSQTVPSPPPPPLPSVVLKVEENTASESGIDHEEKFNISDFKILDSAEYIGKCKKYEADYSSRLMTKYFSKKNLYGGNIFDEKMTINNETIMSSRWPCTHSFADPVKSFDVHSSSTSSEA